MVKKKKRKRYSVKSLEKDLEKAFNF